MVTQSSRPVACHPPPSHIRFRPVETVDSFLLYHTCWQHQPLSRAQHRVNRALQWAEQGRGMGIVIEGTATMPIWGYGQLTVWSGCAEISDLVVPNGYRSRGLGTALIQYLVHQAHAMRVNCVEIGVALSNPRARVLYERLGFAFDYQVMVDVGQGKEPVHYLKLWLDL